MKAENCTCLIPAWETGIIKNVLSITCKLISPYVKKIVVLHCGPLSEYQKCCEYFKGIDNVLFEHYDYKGEAESVLTYLGKFVPENEWALFLDSDHRPTEKFLINLCSSIELLESQNCYFGSIATIHHEFRDGLNIYGKEIPKNQEEVNAKSAYTIKQLVKISKDFKVSTHKGMHYSFSSGNNKSLYLPYGLNHYKLYFEYYSSIFLCGYSDQTVHSFANEDKLKDENCKHFYQQFSELKQKYNMMVSNDFKEKSYSNTIPIEFFEFFSKNNFLRTEDPNISHFLDHAKMFCTKYNFSFDESFRHTRYCGNECCIYNGIKY
jgi:hypothetical protein